VDKSLLEENRAKAYATAVYDDSIGFLGSDIPAIHCRALVLDKY